MPAHLQDSNDPSIRIYQTNADRYHRMIAAEDTDGNLAAYFNRLPIPPGSRLIDLGTGTGRLPILLRSKQLNTVGIDLHRSMLLENQRQKTRYRQDWHLVLADMGAAPVRSGWADLATAGWAIGHLRSWRSRNWKEAIGQVVGEMHRLVKPGGWLVILETLSTGSLEPAPPTPELEEYYRWLVEDWGFSQESIPTDYTFSTVDEAVENTEFFFGSALASRIRQNRWERIPEWTGIWKKQK
jgi:ubiquinone/menaquinone biosynthesis C-methylase UbiE